MDFEVVFRNYLFDGPLRTIMKTGSQGHLKHYDLNGSDDDDEEWRQTLEAYGLASHVIGKVLDPRFKGVGLTKDCKSSTLELLTVNNDTLESAT